MYGDKSTNGGVVIEGEKSCTYEGTPITFIGAQVWCGGCMSVGVIGSKGPHRRSTMMGKQQALDGDICICKCTPSPVLHATQHRAWHYFDPEELRAMDVDASGRSMMSEGHGAYDERVRVLDSNNRPLAGVPYHIRTSRGEVYKGLTDASGYCPRVFTEDTSRLDIAIGINALERWSPTP